MKLLIKSKNILLTLASIALLSSTNVLAKNFEPVIVIHGGTSGLGLTEEEFIKREKVMKESLKAGQNILEKGGSSVDAVIAAIKVMENSPEFNAGKGAVFTSDGFNELDASLMDGKSLNAGAIAMARTIKNPIEAAKIVMDKTPHTLIAGEGADKLAKNNGLEIVNQKYFYTDHRYKQLQDAKKSKKVLLDSDKAKAHLGISTEPYLGTVGAIALDKNGNLAAGTSTGGTTNKMTGRIGDSPIIGAGNYANNDSVAVSCTGTGDIYIRVAAAHEVASLYKYKKLSVQKAAEETIKEVAELGGTGGIISIDKNGKVGYAWTKDKLGMYHGEARIGKEPKIFWPVDKK
ncbi:isoaspartyl peptidase/L-asparaginase family protein [Campylobacter insulaenigrae]|uniref:Isoaspartyl peptidase n=2 Tax=Campylobacter insulaenigrae TaxID=260714 RepID=A0A0A8H5T4_9BACT|nr:isoaspartyl peptidase/L-asparaginase [Campylobacter insulaenigrae]AJC88294.1 L-asparaginase, type 2 (Ntn hydrolase superfamily) [Campylobacter insulaenigrae NCTC 12927]MCR6570964.1 isoaspartyl peptidase/L-asparaginase [Campylobacter insulaenigrae]MCR6573898.1 isoaspartyl peptidase/L-asparaginase [Campylobacter insulaenigrae]MCR6576990.1 isoaspartyl peptidase/L-asparaginase [Campylobacter insulaenigrae]MCR6579240.1 isoaspartyl peptidase/L-asparaginase [Campylobacter insulaenigrae]